MQKLLYALVAALVTALLLLTYYSTALKRKNYYTNSLLVEWEVSHSGKTHS